MPLTDEVIAEARKIASWYIDTNLKEFSSILYDNGIQKDDLMSEAMLMLVKHYEIGVARGLKLSTIVTRNTYWALCNIKRNMRLAWQLVDDGSKEPEFKEFVPDFDQDDMDNLHVAMKSVLTENERLVITECVINGRTLTDVGPEMNVTKERVRQIRNKAIDKLRRYLNGREIIQHHGS